MSAATPDALSTLSTGSKRGPVTSPSRTSYPSSPKSSDDWVHWPENDLQFDPKFDNAWPPADAHPNCDDPDCRFCSGARKVFHICEYTADGRSGHFIQAYQLGLMQCAEVVDDKVDTKELHVHLQELEQLDQSDARTPNHPSMRAFFVCGNYVNDGLSFPHMQHFLAHVRIPLHFTIKHDVEDCAPVFQAAYVPTGSRNTLSGSQRGALHIYLQASTYAYDTEILAQPEYYSARFERDVRHWLKGMTFAALTSTLYLRYDESSRETLICVAGSALTFHSLRGILSAGIVDANQDPFLLIAVFLQLRVAELNTWVARKRADMYRAIQQAKTLTSLDSESSDLFGRFSLFAMDGPTNARLAHEVSSILRAFWTIDAEHRLFLERNGDAHLQGGTAHMIRLRFQRQRARLLELESALSALVTGIEIVKDLIVGRAQIINGIDMAKMAKDNQKQALATEAFAKDARNDSKIMKRDSATMKTITVVTLVYLPATFVSTLLSMGLFDFGVSGGGKGHIRIAREGWVFLAISLPLTAITLGLAWLWKQLKERQWEREEATPAADQRGGNSTGDNNSIIASGSGGTSRAAPSLPEPVVAGSAAPVSPETRLLARLPWPRRRSVRRADLESRDATDGPSR